MSTMRIVSYMARAGFLVTLITMPLLLVHAAPEDFSFQTTAAGFTLPTTMAFAPDGRIFVAEKSGVIKIVKGGVVLGAPFADLSAEVNDAGDRGLLGLALDPNFETNGFVYVSYTFENSPLDYEGPKVGRISRLTAAGDTMVPGSEVVLVGTVSGSPSTPSCEDFLVTQDCIPSDSSSHSVGGLRFGPDGKLYATLGDGAGFTGVDPLALRALDLDSLAGKLIRINTDGTAPSDNPFYTGDSSANRSKVYAYGIRNSFRFNFRPENGSIYLGEVGWAGWEEINVLSTPGANFGWPCREGEFAQFEYDCVTENFTDPMHAWPHGVGGSAAAVGGAFAGAIYPETVQGDYFFGDFVASSLDQMKVDASDALVSLETIFDGTAGGPVEIVTAPDGSIYYLSIFTGEVRRLLHSGMASGTPTAAFEIAVSDLTVTVDGSASSDPNGSIVSYAWSFGDGANGNGATTTHTYAAAGTYTVTLTVTDNDGLSDSIDQQISVGGGVPPGGEPAPIYVSATTTDPNPFIAEPVTITTRVRNDGDPAPFVVDIELYNVATGEQTTATFYENVIIPTGEERTFTLDWLTEADGRYRVSVGLFADEWASLYHWEDAALFIDVRSRDGGGGGEPFTLEHVSTTVSESDITLGGVVTATTNIRGVGSAGSALVDIEIYSEEGVTLAQGVFDNEAFAPGETRSFSLDWTPEVTGQYFVDVGIFTPGWEEMLEWIWRPASFVVHDGEPPPPPVGVPIYTDTLQSGWANWSWETTLDFGAPVAAEGSASISVTYQTPWAGFYLHHDGIDTTGSSMLTFSIHGDAAGGQELQIVPFDASGGALGEVALAPYLTGAVPAGSWVTVSIPLSDLGIENTVFSGFALQGASGEAEPHFYIDDITLQ